MYKPMIAIAALLMSQTALGKTECKAEAIQERLPGVDPSSVTTTPLDGVCEIAIGPQVVYVSPDAKYLIRGDIINIETNVNLTDKRRASARTRVLNGLNSEDLIVFNPEEQKYSITVFTDIDCGYCRKLHREMADLNDKGIQVRYMFFPRSGPNTESWKKAEQVWCSKDRNDAMTRAKNGESVTAESCEAPIKAQYEMGQMVGLRGTPAIVTEDGELISGYLPADALLARLQSLQTAALADE